MTIRIEERHYVGATTDAYGRLGMGHTETVVHEYRPHIVLTPEAFRAQQECFGSCLSAIFGCFESRPACFSFPKKCITASAMVGSLVFAGIGEATNNDAVGATGACLFVISAAMVGFNVLSYCCCRQEEGTEAERQPLLSGRVTSV